MTLVGSDTEQNVELIEEMERRIKNLEEQVQSLRQRVGPHGVQLAARRRKVTADGNWQEFINVVKSLYRPPVSVIPRGAAKLVGSIIGRSPSNASAILRGEQSVQPEWIEKIRQTTPIAPPVKKKSFRKRASPRVV